MDRNRVLELVNKLNTYRDEYYNNSKSVVTDAEYDKLFDKLVKLEAETGIIMSNSPTQTVGYEVKSALRKVTHSHPMMSLDKTKSVTDLVRFIGEHQCILSLKMDGLTCLLTYENGELVKAETRGNGTVGEDILHNAKVFKNIPKTINIKGRYEIEGEIIITYDDFEKINAKIKNIDDKYKNPRNLASGSARQLDSSIAAKRCLKFIAWKDPACVCMSEGLKKAYEYGFTMVPYTLVDKRHVGNLKDIVKQMKEFAETLRYPIDGLVLSYNDMEYGKSLGMTGHHPRHSLAFKFKDDEAETQLLDVEWTMGKNTLTPVAVFEPVGLDGTVVERASLHNVSIMKNLELSVGDTISVYKANAIIPQVSDNIDRSRKNLLVPPAVCPVCGSQTQIIKDNNTEVLVCLNDDCEGKTLRKLCVFVGKDAHDIKGLSEATLKTLLNHGYIDSAVDLFNLKKYRRTLTSVPGFGCRFIDKLLCAIEECKNTTLTRFLIGLSIPLIGRSASKDIESFLSKDFDVKKYNGNIYKYFIESVKNGVDFTQIEGFGSNMQESLIKYFNTHMSDIELLAEQFVFDYHSVSGAAEINDDKLNGKSICITGKLTLHKNRDELVAKIEHYGGKVVSGVTKKTDYLLTNDTNSGSSKNKKAAELNIPIISEEEFVKMIGE